MDGSRSSGGQSGGAGKRLVASNYLLELVPDPRSAESRRRWSYHHSESLFQLPSRPDEHRVHRQDVNSLSQLNWGGGGRPEDKLPAPPTTNKRRLSHPKRRSLSSDQTAPERVTPLDNVLFAESPLHPGVPIVYRTPEERAGNPDRLNLDRRHLTTCPVLEGEERLRLLNLQHNSITRLEHLNGLRRLVFLDLYDNFVREMKGLEGLLSLRVLMLGKNRICRISGLKTLVRLDVLDLHGNQVKEIENLSHLGHLRVLNLAGNEITCVAGLAGLHSLAELNLRRNRITHIYEIDQLPNLQRLFLSHNLIQSFDDVLCLSGCRSLTELNLDGNPLANHPDHRPSLITHIHCLTSLNQTPVQEEERVEAMSAQREEEEKIKELRRRTIVQEYREAAVVAIQRSWDTAHIDQPTHLSASTHDLTTITPSNPSHLVSPSLPHLLPTFLVDLAPPTLHLYGAGSLDALDTPPRDERPLTSLHFHCVEFCDVVPWLAKISRAFPDLDCLCFECTNLTTLDQLNHLSSLPSPLHTLTITPHGNPLTHHPLFTHYTLYRLHHLELSVLNGRAVTQEDMTGAEGVFGTLGRLSSTHLQPERLASLALHHRPKNVRGSKPIPRQSKRRVEEPLDRVTLHTFFTDTSDPSYQTRKEMASHLTSSIHSATLEAHSKLSLLDKSWSGILTDLVRASLSEYSQLDSNMADIFDKL